MTAQVSRLFSPLTIRDVTLRNRIMVIANGQADMVALGNEIPYNPFWTVHAAKKLGVDPTFKNIPV